ncbi:hypothetical protein ACQ4M3_20665 [Leptolyngbya sp. AN03gr2]|uniref:hypothetical protein n=1 Tax=unclassified Leptolyngbya TaxID=2650499 RepID=UPI003D31B916
MEPSFSPRHDFAGEVGNSSSFQEDRAENLPSGLFVSDAEILRDLNDILKQEAQSDSSALCGCQSCGCADCKCLSGSESQSSEDEVFGDVFDDRFDARSTLDQLRRDSSWEGRATEVLREVGDLMESRGLNTEDVDRTIRGLTNQNET